MSTCNIKGYIKEKKWRYLGGLVCLLMINLMQLLIPTLIGNTIDLLKEQKLDQIGLIKYVLMIMLAAVGIWVFHFLSRLQIIGAGNLFDYRLRSELFSKITKLSRNFYNKNRIGDLMALSTNDIPSIRQAMGRGFNIFFNTVFLFISSIIILSKTINVKLTLICFVPLPFLILIMAKFGLLINKRFRKVQQSFANLTSKVEENVSGIRVIKAFVQQDCEKENFKKINEENYAVNMELAKVSSIFFPLITFISAVIFLLLLVYGGINVINGTISIGDFIAFNGYVGLIVRPIGFIGMIINMIQKGKVSLTRLDKIFSNNEDVVEEKNKDNKLDEKLKGDIVLNNLNFSYTNSGFGLKNINIHIPKGKILGVVGKVGSGKTTLVQVLLRLYEPKNRGQYFIDGKDIFDISIPKLRDSIGYVPQDDFLFSVPIKDNINFTPYNLENEMIINAAKTSQIYDDIMEFPDEFSTVLGERGTNISGGQKQRISIARALAKNPSILILDDCLSAVDTKTEEKILSQLKANENQYTCIMIAHRISTIQHADEIVVLDEGEIVERGSHEKLLKQEGKYFQMYMQQQLEEQIAQEGVDENGTWNRRTSRC